MMAKKHPTTTSHHGARGGKVRAISQPVTTALPSLKNRLSGLFSSLSMKASAISTAAVAMASCISTTGPISQT